MVLKKSNIIVIGLMVLLSVVTQILTLAKASIAASAFGASDAMDAYNFANSIVSLFFGIVAAGIPTIVLPSYARGGERRHVDAFVTLVFLFLFLAIVAFATLRYQLIGLMASRSEVFVNICCNVLLILFMAQYLASFAGIVEAFLQSENKYIIPKIVNLVSQAAVVAALLVLPLDDIYAYIIVVASGMVISFVGFVFSGFACGWRFRPRLIHLGPEVKMLLFAFLPIVLSSGVYQLSLFVDSYFSAGLETGFVTILAYASQVANLIDALIIGNLLSFAYPKIVALIEDGKKQDFFWDIVVSFHAVTTLIIVGYAAVGHEGVRLLFQHGAFGQDATRLVYFGSLLYVFSQQFNVVRNLLYRYFYADNNTKPPAKNSVITTVINVSSSFVLMQIFGYFGIIAGTVISSLFSVVSIFLRFKNEYGYDGKIKSLLSRFARNILVAGVTFALVSLSKSMMLGLSDLLQIVCFGFESVVLFGGLTMLVNRQVIDVIRKM